MIDERKDEGQTISILSPSFCQWLAEEKWSYRVKEVRSLPLWQECGYYHATAMGIKLSYFYHVQLPAGDKHCLDEPVNSPATLGTCSYHVNWCIHLQHCCLIIMQQKRMGKMWFKVKVNYCNVLVMHIRMHWEFKKYRHKERIRPPSIFVWQNWR